MEGVTRIIQRFVMVTIFLSIFLSIFNFILLGTMVFTQINKNPSPRAMIKNVAQGLVKQGENYVLKDEAKKLLQQNQAWAMWMNKHGQVRWEYQKPPEVPNSYHLIEVAKFSRYYLLGYPVYIQEHLDGLVVVDYPKNSYWKYQLNFLTEGVRSLPLRLVLLLLFNFLLSLLIAIVLGLTLIRKVRPLIEGVHQLVKEEKVELETKGIFRDLARSINSVSEILQKRSAALKSRDEARSNWISGISKIFEPHCP